jgi:hypothetical protein
MFLFGAFLFAPKRKALARRDAGETRRDASRFSRSIDDKVVRRHDLAKSDGFIEVP